MPDQAKSLRELVGGIAASMTRDADDLKEEKIPSVSGAILLKSYAREIRALADLMEPKREAIPAPSLEGAWTEIWREQDRVIGQKIGERINKKESDFQQQVTNFQEAQDRMVILEGGASDGVAICIDPAMTENAMVPVSGEIYLYRKGRLVYSEEKTKSLFKTRVA